MVLWCLAFHLFGECPTWNIKPQAEILALAVWLVAIPLVSRALQDESCTIWPSCFKKGGGGDTHSAVRWERATELTWNAWFFLICLYKRWRWPQIGSLLGKDIGCCAISGGKFCLKAAALVKYAPESQTFLCFMDKGRKQRAPSLLLWWNLEKNWVIRCSTCTEALTLYTESPDPSTEE